jgi:tetratricopeptide (TPR) repeat protein
MAARVFPFVLLALLAGALAAAATVPFVAKEPAGLSESSEALQRASVSLGELARRLDDVEREMVELRAERAAPAAARVSLEELEGAVASYMESQAPRSDASAASADAPGKTALAADAGTVELSVDEAFARLSSGELSQSEHLKLWADMGKRGLSDALVKKYEEAVERSPNDPDLRSALGDAYIQKIFEAGGSTPMAGMWAMKADGAFDAALAIDDHHWDARFSKAVSYSFWPPALGMQNKAIAQFEILLEQQEGQPASPQFAQTYYFLGNMYQQTGNADKALQTWKQGLSLYPDDAQLQGQVAAVK